ncbi:MAG: tyrosine-type recombinase/integrase [Novosphingobium sp.]|jgi:integrase|nr:tyrosine-type recombinase/integrase [Novosphingobium sp.]
MTAIPASLPGELPAGEMCLALDQARSGIARRVALHDLPHSFASHAVMTGETLLTTSRLLGHSRVQMTARYAHLADTALLATAEKIGAMLMTQAGAERRTAEFAA